MATLTASQKDQLIAQLLAERDALLKANAERGTIAFKVSEKGGVSVCGLGRFPVTLYASQWDRLLAKDDNGSYTHIDRLVKFIADNRSKLSVKKAA